MMLESFGAARFPESREARAMVDSGRRTPRREILERDTAIPVDIGGYLNTFSLPRIQNNKFLNERK